MKRVVIAVKVSDTNLFYGDTFLCFSFDFICNIDNYFLNLLC